MKAGERAEMLLPRTVAVVGLGLMGGSLCRALKALDSPPRVIGWDLRQAAGAMALEAGAVDRFEVGGPEGLAAAGLVVYATPLRATLSLIPRHAGMVREDAVLTDVVSLNEPVLRAAQAAGLSGRFVSAHPICGGEASGFAAGRADLYRGATVWLSAGGEGGGDAHRCVESLWRTLGGSPRWVAPGEHDRRMGWVSHLPQLVANALAAALDAQGCSPDELGPGGRDMTRLAGSNPTIWRDLLEASAPVTGAGLTGVANALNVLADLLARRELDRVADFMERTRRWTAGE
ncbi:MAG: prephenate dehydrogenase [Gammaproteobacteria bacterium]|nr:prephenate dehydrogenase [Gammaproteobacteria bacterium]MDE0247714.1 prephenate dehydrogenase [Gammaproteobacteria bacterium]